MHEHKTMCMGQKNNTMKQLIKDIISSLEEYRDSNRIEYAKKSYPTKMQVIGVTVPNLKIVLKELKIHTKNYSIRDKIELAKELNRTSIFECQQLAFEYIGNDKKISSQINEQDIAELELNLDNWLSVDYFGALIVGNSWRNNNITIDKVKTYLKSNDFWIRRIAIVATVSLNQKARGGTGDALQTLEICKLVVDDHEDMIIKALSWALRELTKVEKKAVIEFIDNYKDKLHKKVLREVTNKIKIGTKS